MRSNQIALSLHSWSCMAYENEKIQHYMLANGQEKIYNVCMII